jgi:hypothetical protein
VTWQTARTLTAQAVEAGAPIAANFVDLELSYANFVELSFTGTALGGAPGSVTLGVWHRSDAQIDRLCGVTIDAADVAAPEPVLLDWRGEKIHVRVESFTGGTAPTFTGTVNVVRQAKPG